MANRTRRAKMKQVKERATKWFWISKELNFAEMADGSHKLVASKGKTYDPHKKLERAWAEWAKRRKERGTG